MYIKCFYMIHAMQMLVIISVTLTSVRYSFHHIVRSTQVKEKLSSQALYKLICSGHCFFTGVMVYFLLLLLGSSMSDLKPTLNNCILTKSIIIHFFIFLTHLSLLIYYFIPLQ